MIKMQLEGKKTLKATLYPNNSLNLHKWRVLSSGH
jgi:hypothetical protein